MKTLMRTLASCLMLSVCVTANAHFIWLVPNDKSADTTKIEVYFGEDATDESSEFLSRLEGLELRTVSGKRAPEVLKMAKTDDGISAHVSFDRKTVVVTSHDLGVMDRGDSVFRLKYYAKAGPDVTDPAWKAARSSDVLELDVVPTLKGNTVRIRVSFAGQPIPDAQVSVSGPGLDDFEGNTNARGVVRFPVTNPGLFSVRARHIQNLGGEIDGKEYSETRHYSTVAVRVPVSHSPIADLRLQNVPQPVTSFGAAVTSDGLFIYGGHTGNAHSYSMQEQSNRLLHLNLKTGGWKTEATGPHLQGLALVAHEDTLYRIGGFTAENAEGEEHKLVSKSNVALYSRKDQEWVALPSLPEGRSSHDAAVVGDSIYVVGGWQMSDDAETTWHKTAWTMDLKSSNPEWTAIAGPPFERRAIAAAAHGGKLYIIGGMEKDSGPTTKVAIYDPKTNAWSEGPNLQVTTAEPSDGENTSPMSSGRMAGFGASAFATGGSLYLTTVQGNLQKLNEDGSEWKVIKDDVSPRFFHRMLALDRDHLITVGGSNMSTGKFEEVEIIPVGRDSGK